jgi:hypothetical protein
MREMVWEWDPIGLFQSRHLVEDEYDCIVEHVLPLLRQAASKKDISDFLDRLLPEHFGLNPQPTQAGMFADRIIGWWQQHQSDTSADQATGYP